MIGMTGLEAIEFMKQGGKVINQNDDKIIYKIEEGVVLWKLIGEEDYCYTRERGFDFTVTYEEYIEPKQLTGWERVDKGKEFYYINELSMLKVGSEKGSISNARNGVFANYFSTKEKAEEVNFKQTLFRKLQRFSDENCGSEIDWNDEHQKKYFIYYVHDRSRITTSHCYQHHYFGQIHFSSEEVAKQAIELFHDDLIKYFTM